MNTGKSAVIRTGVIVTFLLTIVTGLASAQNEPGLGVVQYLEGDVRINGVPADFGDRVAFGDRLQTGPDGYVDIVFDRSNIFRLGSNTVAVIKIGASRQSVDLQFGTFSAVFSRLRTLTGHDTFTVRAPTVAGGVRGTSFFFRVLDRNTTYVCSCNGSLELDDLGPTGPFVDSAVSHSARYFRNVDGEIVTERADEIFHSSESLNEIADVIGLEIPWGSVPASSVN
jgi:hypothetical protein